MLIIKQTKYSGNILIISSTITEYFVFNTDEEFEDHKLQNELIMSGVSNIIYDEISLSTLKFLSVNDFKSTSLEQFIKIQKVLN